MNATNGEIALSESNQAETLSQHTERPWFRIYLSTTTLILVVHVIYLYQLLRITSRKTIVTSYATLIRKKKFFKAIIALLSHAPTRIRSPGLSGQSNSRERNSIMQPILEWYHSSIFFNGRRLSGFPLLFYNAFILWNCRALEPMFGESYWRLLWGVTFVALGLDLWFTKLILTIVRDMQYGVSSPFSMGASLVGRTELGSSSRVVERVERILSRRTIGSLTMTSAAVLAIFQDSFPYVPIPVLPLLGSSLPFVSIPSLSYAMCLSILFFLSRSIHPVTGVICGTLSGMLWSSKVTSFFVEPYWSNGTIFVCCFMCVISLKASGSTFWPCVQVGWDHHGHMVEEEYTLQSLFLPDTTIDSDSEQSNSDLVESQRSSQEMLPLFRGQERDDDEIIRHRLPLAGLDDDDVEISGNESYPSGANNNNSSPRVRSRRGTNLR